MAFNIKPQTRARLRAKAQEQGVSIDVLLDQLMNDSESKAAASNSNIPELPAWHLGARPLFPSTRHLRRCPLNQESSTRTFLFMPPMRMLSGPEPVWRPKAGAWIASYARGGRFEKSETELHRTAPFFAPQTADCTPICTPEPYFNAFYGLLCIFRINYLRFFNTRGEAESPPLRHQILKHLHQIQNPSGQWWATLLRDDR